MVNREPLCGHQPKPPDEAPLFYLIRVDRPEHEPFLLAILRNTDYSVASYAEAYLPRDAAPMPSLTIAEQICHEFVQATDQDDNPTRKTIWDAKEKWLKYEPWKKWNPILQVFEADTSEKDHERRTIENAKLTIVTDRYVRVKSFDFALPTGYEVKIPT